MRREHCTVCGAGGLAPILTTPPYPVYQGCVAFAPGPDERAAMDWASCSACGSAQIVTLPPLARIYQAGHATGLGAAWARHHAAFAGFVKAHAAGAIVDVGGGSGTLAAAYRRAGGDAAYTILEPHALRSPELPADIRVIDGFLDGASLADANSVVMSHVLEHVTDLRAALATLTEAQDCAHVIVAWPDLDKWLAKGMAGALNFEHGIYVGVARLAAVFAQFGWTLEARVVWEENDTVFLAFVRGSAGAAVAPPATGRARTAIAAYYAGFRARARALNAALAGHDGDAFLMPASVYAQALIAEGLDAARFKALLDNAAVKQYRRLSGTNLLVAAPEMTLPGARHPLVVLNGGAHEGEIAARLRARRADVMILRSDATPL
ncbi:MAG: methyltransferase domain-containing protein [Rhizomicrobium sp.]